MRLRDLAGEAWRNVCSGAARPLTAAVLVAVPVAGLIVLETSTVNSAESDASRFREAQSAVYVLSAPQAVSGTACDDLASVPGISKAGALSATNRGVASVATPFTPIPLFDATAAFGAFLDTDLRRGVAVELDVANSYGLPATGKLWDTNSGRLAVAGAYAYPDDGRNPQLQFAVVGAADRSSYDQCWIETWPFDPDRSVLLYSALQSGDAVAEATVTQLNPRNGSRLSARSSFPKRSSRWSPWIALLWSGTAIFGVSRIRRLEFAFARHLGARKGQLALLVALETLLWAVPFGLMATAWLAILGSSGEISVTSAWYGERVLTFAVVGMFVGATLGGAANREKDLFSFFKRRT